MPAFVKEDTQPIAEIPIQKIAEIPIQKIAEIPIQKIAEIPIQKMVEMTIQKNAENTIQKIAEMQIQNMEIKGEITLINFAPEPPIWGRKGIFRAILRQAEHFQTSIDASTSKFNLILKTIQF